MMAIHIDIDRQKRTEAGRRTHRQSERDSQTQTGRPTDRQAKTDIQYSMVTWFKEHR